jgi:hypothetical protein
MRSLVKHLLEACMYMPCDVYGFTFFTLIIKQSMTSNVCLRVRVRVLVRVRVPVRVRVRLSLPLSVGVHSVCVCCARSDKNMR